MHGPPPTPDEFHARLWRYVRDPRFAELRFEDALVEAAQDFDRTAYEILGGLGDIDV